MAAIPAGPAGWTGSTATNDTMWVQWQSTATTTANVPWPAWCSTAGTSVPFVVSSGTQWYAWNDTWTETQEQHQARERTQAQTLLRQQEAAKAQLVAKERALELLGYVLTPAQMATYRDRGWFEVVSSRGRRWRIRDRGQSGNVDLMPEIGDERLASYCAHPPGGLPDPDAHLAQALQLATDEDAFLAVANCHYRRPAA